MAFIIVFVSTSCKKAPIDNNSKVQASEAKISWSMDVDEPTQEYRKTYQNARELQEQKKYQEAFDLYSTIDQKYQILYDLVLFNRSEVAKQIPDEASVIKDLKELIDKYPDSPVVDLATYSLGQAYVRIKDDKNAIKYFEQTVTKFPNSKYAIAANYYLGELYAKEPNSTQKVINHFELYLKEAPDGKFAVNCADAIVKLKPSNLSDADKELVGIAYYNGGNYNKAIKYLSTVFNDKTWYSLGKSYQLTAQQQKAMDTFSKALNSFSGLCPDEVDNAIKAIALMKGNTPEAWQYCEKVFPSHADVAIYFQAKRLYNTQAVSLYKKIVDSFPDSQYAPESSWVVFWDMFNNKKYKEAIAQGKKHIKKYSDSASSTRIVYWVGKSYERLGEKDNAITIYQRMQNHYLADYYAYRAKSRLAELKHSKPDKQWQTVPSGYAYNNEWSAPVPIEYKEIASMYGAKIAELLYLGDMNTVALLLDENIDPRLDSYFKFNDGLASRSIVVLRDDQKNSLKKTPGNDKAWELLYPLHFSTLVKTNAAKNNLDPLLVQALTREESYFNPQAVSSSNAKGLMQLMPATAQSVAEWEKLNNFSQLDLFKPEVNLRLGSRYLKYTHDRFNGNSMLAVASYNGGPGNVNKWVNTLPNSDWDQFVENIPLDETREYVRKVFRSYWAYKDIYLN